MMHFHRWGNWEDVKVEDKAEGCGMVSGILVIRKVVSQQRRCATCNIVRTRYSA